MAASISRHKKRIDFRISLDLKTSTLTPQDWNKFLAALEGAEQPRPKLEAAVRRYRRRRP